MWEILCDSSWDSQARLRGLREEDMRICVGNEFSCEKCKNAELNEKFVHHSNSEKRFVRIDELREIGLSQAVLEKLADADAFNSMGLDRREALWEISTGNDRPIALFAGQSAADPSESEVSLPKMRTSEHVLHDYAAISLSLKAHPVSFVREKLSLLHVLSASDLSTARDGDMVKVAGLVLVRQRPGTAAGVCFITIEDETGCANLVVWESLFDEFRKEILQSRLLMVEGKLQVEGEVIHVIVRRCYDFTKLLHKLSASEEDLACTHPSAR